MAIGYVGFGYIDGSIKPLKVNNIEPTLKNAKTKVYPITRKLFMYVNANRYSPHAAKFVQFLLGPKGQNIVKEVGYIPL